MSAGPHTDTFWTDERIERLKTLRAEGHSSSQIAGQLGCTRNAVIGKAVRLGLAKTATGITQRKPRVRKAKNVWRSAASGRSLRLIESVTSDPMELVPTEPINPTNFLDLKAEHCRWPCSGEGIGTVFCGGPAIEGKPYCIGHCCMAYVPPGQRTSRREFEKRGRKLRASHKAQAA